MLLFAERGAGLGFDEAEDEEGDADDADQCVDAVVVVQEDRPDLERLVTIQVFASSGVEGVVS